MRSPDVSTTVCYGAQIPLLVRFHISGLQTAITHTRRRKKERNHNVHCTSVYPRPLFQLGQARFVKPASAQKGWVHTNKMSWTWSSVPRSEFLVWEHARVCCKLQPENWFLPFSKDKTEMKEWMLYWFLKTGCSTCLFQNFDINNVIRDVWICMRSIKCAFASVSPSASLSNGLPCGLCLLVCALWLLG